jgi:hypothetical protein
MSYKNLDELLRGVGNTVSMLRNAQLYLSGDSTRPRRQLVQELHAEQGEAIRRLYGYVIGDGIAGVQSEIAVTAPVVATPSCLDQSAYRRAHEDEPERCGGYEVEPKSQYDDIDRAMNGTVRDPEGDEDPRRDQIHEVDLIGHEQV